MKIRWYCNIRSWLEIVIKLYSIKCSMLHCFVQGVFVMFFSCGWPCLSLGTSASTSGIKTRSVRKRVKQVHAQPCVIKPWPHWRVSLWKPIHFDAFSSIVNTKTTENADENGGNRSKVDKWKQCRKKGLCSRFFQHFRRMDTGESVSSLLQALCQRGSSGDERGLVEKKAKGEFPPSPFLSRIPLVARPRFQAIVPTDRQPGTD